MQARVTKEEGSRLTLKIELDLGSYRTLVDCEEGIQQVLNEAGVVMTAEALEHFDADGQPLVREGRKYTSKGGVPRYYESPYGSVLVERTAYQHSGGGPTYIPLDHQAGIVLSATPKFARMIASKFAEFGSARVLADLAENHGRTFSRGFVAHLAEAVAALAEFQADQTKYPLPDFEKPTVTLVVGLDEVEIASRPTRATAAIGSVSFYDADGHRQYVLYVTDLFESGSPENPLEPDRGRFLGRMKDELDRALRKQRQVVRLIGVSGGQPWTVEFLEKWLTDRRDQSERTDGDGREWQTGLFIDPEKVMETLAPAAQAYFDQVQRPGQEEVDDSREPAWRGRERERWLDNARHQIRRDPGVRRVISQLEQWLSDPLPDEARARIAQALEFLSREHAAGRLNYQDPAAWMVFASDGLLAGLAEAVLGDRLNHPKFKIGLKAARAILILRELTRTPGRWDEFWDRVTHRPQFEDQSGR
jgi:hypothetical protein